MERELLARFPFLEVRGREVFISDSGIKEIWESPQGDEIHIVYSPYDSEKQELLYQVRSFLVQNGYELRTQLPAGKLKPR